VISGSQDSIGIVFPGLAKAYYEGKYWPTKIEHVIDESLVHFVESSLYLVALGPRFSAYDVLVDTKFSRELAKALADAADFCWDAILDQDIVNFGRSLRESFEAQVAMFPHMLNDRISELIDQYRDLALGWKLSGAGGGGYLILVAEKPIPDTVRVLARRETE
jgi:galactokinase/mevalonate kinase-like predicted kinase